MYICTYQAQGHAWGLEMVRLISSWACCNVGRRPRTAAGTALASNSVGDVNGKCDAEAENEEGAGSESDSMIAFQMDEWSNFFCLGETSQTCVIFKRYEWLVELVCLGHE